MRPKPDRLLDYREFPVLYVDDEPENLRIFELAFRREFSIVTALSADEALTKINSMPVAIVLSDQKMPGMKGTEFLARVSEIDSKTVRILVTAYGDAGTLEHAINSGSIYRYIAKPWQPDEMRLALRRGIEVYALDMERDHLVRELTLLNGVSRSISRELDLEALFDLIVGTASREFGFDAASLMVVERHTGELRWADFSDRDSAANQAIRNLVFSQKSSPKFFGSLEAGCSQTLRFRDIDSADSPVRVWVTEIAAEETVVLPLCGGGSVVGALAVDNRKGGRRFSAEDWTLLEGLANQSAIAIQNALLVEDLRHSREQILRSDRLGTLGTLAAGLAHEINNPLVSIRTFLSMAPARRLESNDEFWVEYHSLALEEVERIRRLIDTMQGLGRNPESVELREVIDFADIATQVATLVQGEAAASNVEVTTIVEPECKIVGVRDQIHQLVLNLVVNGIHAARGGGRVDISVRPWSEEGVVVLEVADDGSGISDENLEKIFDPFFTTKGPDEGTGLGLMICHRIAEDHLGSIEVEGREGSGARFRVRFPSDRTES